MRKILGGLAVLAVLAMAAFPAFAFQLDLGDCALVKNVQKATTNTGLNGIANADGCDAETDSNDDNTILTGQALSFADAKTIANSNLRDGCCEEGGQMDCHNCAMVENIQIVKANTGLNGIANADGDCDGYAHDNDGNWIETGFAGSQADALTIANSNLEEGCCDNQFDCHNCAMVKNIQVVKANTGLNGIANASGCDADTDDNNDNLIWTGGAQSVANAITIVNSNIQRGGY